MSDSESEHESELDFSPSEDEYVPDEVSDSYDDGDEDEEEEEEASAPKSFKNVRKTKLKRVTRQSTEEDDDSDSSVENYLVNPNEIDLASDFFSSNANIDSIQTPVPQFDCNAGLNLSDSEEEVFDEVPSTSHDAAVKLLDFNAHENFSKDLENAKKQLLNFKSTKFGQLNGEVDVTTLLAIGETSSVVPKSVKSKRRDVSSDESDFEEVEEDVKTEKKSDIEVRIGPAIKKKPDRYQTEIEASIKRKINRRIKENQLMMHKVHLLSWIGYGNFVNKVLNSTKLMEMVVKYIPSEKSYPKGQTDQKYFEQITKFYKTIVGLKNKEQNCSLKSLPPIATSLALQIQSKMAICKKDFVFIFIILLRSMGIQCRLVINLATVPMRPAAKDLCVISTKSNEKSNENAKKEKKSTKNESINGKKKEAKGSKSKLKADNGRTESISATKSKIKSQSSETSSQPKSLKSKIEEALRSAEGQPSIEDVKGKKLKRRSVSVQSASSVNDNNKRSRLTSSTDIKPTNVTKKGSGSQNSTENDLTNETSKKRSKRQVMSLQDSSSANNKFSKLSLNVETKTKPTSNGVVATPISRRTRNATTRSTSVSSETVNSMSIPQLDGGDDKKKKKPNTELFRVKLPLRSRSESPTSSSKLLKVHPTTAVGKGNSKLEKMISPSASVESSSKSTKATKRKNVGREERSKSVDPTQSKLRKPSTSKAAMPSEASLSIPGENSSTNTEAQNKNIGKPKRAHSSTKSRSTSTSKATVLVESLEQEERSKNANPKKSKSRKPSTSKAAMPSEALLSVPYENLSTNTEVQKKNIGKPKRAPSSTKSRSPSTSKASVKLETSSSPSKLSSNSDNKKPKSSNISTSERDSRRSKFEKKMSNEKKKKKKPNTELFRVKLPLRSRSESPTSSSKLLTLHPTSAVGRSNSKLERKMSPSTSVESSSKLTKVTKRKNVGREERSKSVDPTQSKSNKRSTSEDASHSEIEKLRPKSTKPEVGSRANISSSRTKLEKLPLDEAKPKTKRTKRVQSQSKTHSASTSQEANRPKEVTKRPDSPIPASPTATTSTKISTTSNRTDTPQSSNSMSNEKSKKVPKSSIVNKSTKSAVKRKSANSASSDSDFVPTPKKKLSPAANKPLPKQVEKLKKRIDRRILSTDDESNEPSVKKDDMNYWIEVFCESERKWLCIDLFKMKVNCVEEIKKKATKPIVYVLAWNNNNKIKDVSPRYCSQWNTTTRKLRVQPEWLDEALRPYKEPLNQRCVAEDRELEEIHAQTPVPKSISELKNHPLYVLPRHLLKFEGIYPPNPVPIAFIRDEPIYSRLCVHTLHSREIWVKQARVVKPGETPYKIVKARPKWDRLNNKMLEPQALEIFGYWQTGPYIPPTAENGIVPRNAYGNVELFKPEMLPKKTVHLRFAGLNRICAKLKIDCAQAVVGFDFHGGSSHPTFDGFVVCEEFAELVTEKWCEEQEEAFRKSEEKQKQRVHDNWKKLVKGLLIRERLQRKYNFAGKDASGAQKDASPKKK